MDGNSLGRIPLPALTSLQGGEEIGARKRYRAVFLDFWETIAFSRQGPAREDMGRRVFSKMQVTLESFGFSVKKEDLEARIEAALTRREEKAREGFETSSWLSIAKALEDMDIPWEGPIVALLRRDYREIVLESGLELRSGLRRILEYLMRKGIKRVLVSNTSQGDLERKFLERHGLLHYFDALVFSSEEGYRKPRREIFGEALRIAGVPPHEALHVGDLPELDVMGAHNAGIDVCWIRSKKYSEDPPAGIPRPTFVIEDLRDLMEIL